jgi:hypothetical protein
MKSGRLTSRAAAVAILAASGSVHAQNWSPDPALIQRIEKQLVLPPGSKLLEAYTRYYFGTSSGERQILGGTFLHESREAGGVKIVNQADAPLIFDGGCTVVHLKYDIQDDKTVSIFCNGEA